MQLKHSVLKHAYFAGQSRGKKIHVPASDKLILICQTSLKVRYCKMGREGVWVVSIESIDHDFTYISGDLNFLFKEPRPFKQQKLFLSGLTTFHVYWLNHVSSCV